MGDQRPAVNWFTWAVKRLWGTAVPLFVYIVFACAQCAAAQVTVVDVMVLYTPQAKAGAGGDAAIRSEIDIALVEANYVLQLSQINARLRLAHVAEVPYTEHGRLLTNLHRLKLPSDGYLDQVHALRDQHTADLVCLVTEAGFDYAFYGLQGPSPSNAFSVIRRRYLTADYFFPVTLGFNFGCQLERPYADSVGAFPFSYGYTFSSEVGPLSTVEALSEERRPFFSNPHITAGGVAAGVPAGQPGAADNARTINLTAPIVAAFRGESPVTLAPDVSLSVLGVAGTNRLDVFANTNLVFAASATDQGGSIERVEFWQNDDSEKHWRRLAVLTDGPFHFTWTNLTSGSWQIFAQAVDQHGAAQFSKPVSVRVLPAPPPNDDFTNAIVLEGTNVTIVGDNTLATLEPSETAWNQASVWYAWTATESGRLTISVPETILGTTFAVFTGNAVTNLTTVANNGSQWGGRSSRIEVDVWAGTVYRISLQGVFGDPSVFTLSLAFLPTIQVRLVQPAEGERFMSSQSVNVMAEASPPERVTQVEFISDLIPFATATNEPFSVLWTNAAPGSHSLFARAFDLAGGAFDSAVVHITVIPGNDDFARRTALVGSSISVTGSTRAATNEAGEPVHAGASDGKSVWWSWTAPSVGRVRVTVLPISVWPSFGIYTGNSVTGLSNVASNRGLFGFSATAVFDALAGLEYQIAVSGAGQGPSEGEFILNFEFLPAPSNDDFANRQSFPGLSGSVAGWTWMASKEADEPNHAGNRGGRSVWWSWTPTSSSAVEIKVAANQFTPLLAVYTGDQLANLIPVASGTNCPLTVRPVPGVSYQIAVDGLDGIAGEFTLALTAAPLNDDFAGAIPLSGFQVSVRGTNTAASKEPGEPQHAGTGAGKSVWWAWSAQTSGWVDVNTFGTTFDLRMAIYAGTGLSNLAVLVATEAQAGETFTFRAIAGQTYWIAADALAQGCSTTSGEVVFVLNETPAPPNDDFANRTHLVGTNLMIPASNNGAGLEPGEPALCLQATHSVWWSWAAPGHGQLTVRADRAWGEDQTTCLATFTGTTLTNLSPVGRWELQGVSGVSTVSTAPGVTYLIAVDNFLNLSGDFVLTLHFDPSPANDFFTNRTALVGTNFIVTASNSGATREPGEPLHGGIQGEGSVWWSWTASGDGTANISLSGFPNLISGVYLGSRVNALIKVNAIDSGTVYAVRAGLTYQIAADGYRTAWDAPTGDVSLHVDYLPPPPNDNFVNRQLLSGNELVVRGYNRGASTEPGELNLGTAGRSVWYSWTAPSAGSVTIDTGGSEMQTATRVYTGAALATLQLVTGGNSMVGFSAEGGRTYQIWVDSYFAGTGGQLSLSLDFSSLRITSPTNGTVLRGVASLEIVAETSPSDGVFERLEFLADNAVIGIDTTAPYSLVWSNVPSGIHNLAVRGTNTTGRFRESALVSVHLRPPNDDFAFPQTVVGTQISTGGSTIGATKEAGEPDHAGSAGGTSVWYSWTAPDSGTYAIVIRPRFDNLLAVYTGTELTNLYLLASNAHGPVRIQTQAGSNYVIAVDSAGSFVIDILRPPVNDNFADRLVLPSDTVFVTATNLGASFESGEPSLGPMSDFSIWWSWTAPFTGELTVNTGPMVWFSLLSFYTGTELTNLVRVANVAGTGFFQVTSGTTYHIAASGVWNDDRAVDLMLVQPGANVTPNDEFSRRIGLNGTNIFLTASNTTATREVGEPFHAGQAGGRSVWWSWTAPANGQAVLNVAPTGFTPLLAAYLGDTVSNLTTIGSAIDTTLTFPALGGATYQIAVDGDGGTGGSFSLSLTLVTPPTNDAFTNRIGFTGDSAVLSADNTFATTESGEVLLGGGTGRTLWWAWTAPHRGLVKLDIPISPIPRHRPPDTPPPGSDRGSLVGVWQGTVVTNLALLASNNSYFAGGPGWPAGWRVLNQLVFPVSAGVSYEFSVDGCNGTTGPFSIGFGFVPSPANDDFSERAGLTGTTNEVHASNVAATRQSGEPNHAGDSGGASLWWSWTAPFNGPVRLRDNGSEFIPLFAVYTGDALATLQEISSESNNVRFVATAGMTYQIAVDGPGGVSGDIAFSLVLLHPPPNDDFGARIALIGTSASANGWNDGATKEVGEPNHAGKSAGVSLWWSWTAPSPGRARISASADFRPVLAAYTGTRVDSLLSVAAGLDELQFYAVPGQTYAIAIDSENAQTGDILLTVEFQPAPPNDAFANRISVMNWPPRLSGTLASASREAGEPAIDPASAGATVWFTWKSPVSGTITISDPTWSASVIAEVFVGSSFNRLLPVARGAAEDSYRLSFYALAGVVYQIRVSDVGGYEGNFELEVDVPPLPPGINSTSAPRMMADGFHLRVAGMNGQSFVLQVSTNLIDWSTLAIDTLQGTALDFLDVEAALKPQRFYRVLAMETVVARDPMRVSSGGLDKNGRFKVLVTGSGGQPFLLQASEDLKQWTDLTSGILFGDSSEFSDIEASTFPHRFYRALPEW